MSRQDAIEEVFTHLKFLRAISMVAGTFMVGLMFKNWSDMSSLITVACVITILLYLASVVIAQCRINEILRELKS